MGANEDLNIQVSDETVQELTKALQSDEMKGKAVRLTVAGMGCSGPMLGLALDDPNERDTIFSSGVVQLLADDVMKQEIVKGGGLNMEYINDPMRGQGIAITFANPADCSSGCGGGCSCG